MAATTHEPQRGLTFDDVWAALMELREEQREGYRQMKEAREEMDRQMQKDREAREEADRQMREAREEADRRMQKDREEADRRIGRLGNRLGDLIEHLTAANLLEKFQDLGYTFTQISQNIKIKNPDKRILAEIDMLLENGDYAMAVEVKSRLTLMDVQEHIRRMETLRAHADARNDTRKYVSSVSGALVDGNARDFALNKGIYVIEHSGDTVRIRAPQKVRTW
ncbi:MAG: hypothetical protein LBQ35_07730 [Spirochaetaceae bacterium]|jgi:uncharacterized coiled-coil DUF342 family protein|nr:hypothetical protein [Spirochaetaceae bacterium]